MVERFVTIKMQMLKVNNNLFLVSTGRKLLEISINEKVDLLNATLNIFRNYIPSKIVK